MLRLEMGDAIELMNTLSSKSIDLVLTDPPYGTTQNAWDSVIDLDQMWEQIRRVLTPNGVVVMTASQPFTSALVMSNPKWFRHEWIWEKNKASGHLNAKSAPMKAHESIIVFSPKKPKYNPQKTSGHAPMNAYYTSHNGSNYGEGRHMSGGGSTQRYPRSVQRFAVVNNDSPEKVHPTQKPLELGRYLIETYSDPLDTVLDFCMGSGTFGVAAIEAMRCFIGFDNDQETFNHAQHRIICSLKQQTVEGTPNA